MGRGNNALRIAHPSIKVNGSLVEAADMDQLIELVVDSSLHLPDMAVITFHDETLDLINSSKFPLGAPLEISMSDYDDPRSHQVMFKGEIVALEPEFNEGVLATLTIRGYAKSYRLHRETVTKAWVEVTDSDIAQAIAGNAGLSPEVESTTEVFKHVFQNALTDMAFLQQRAMRIGYEVFVQDEKLYFRKPDPTGSQVELEFGKVLRSFRPALSVSDQVNEVTVKGWDVQKKEAITGVASTSPTAPSIGLGQWGGQAAQSAISAAKKLQVRRPVQSQADAESVAKAILNEVNAGFIEAEGEADGQPDLKAGMLIKITKLGAKFSGVYKLTAIRHVYNPDSFTSYFTVEGTRPRILTQLLREQEQEYWGGVVSAIVTNNQSPDDWGMVKVKYPWLADTEESYWARLTGPGIGKDRGIYFLPEVNDEVLVAFEHGDFNRPYILGGLYNGKDAPAEAIGTVVQGGNVETRVIKTRAGHIIRLTDTSGSEKIEIIDSKSEMSMSFDSASKTIDVGSQGKINLTAQQDISIEATGNISISANGKIDIEATQGLTLNGMTVDLSAQSSATLKANAQMTVQGGSTKVQGQATTDIIGSASVAIQGGVVRIN